MPLFLLLSSVKKKREKKIKKVVVAIKFSGKGYGEGVLRAESWGGPVRGLIKALQPLSCFQAPSESQ